MCLNKVGLAVTSVNLRLSKGLWGVFPSMCDLPALRRLSEILILIGSAVFGATLNLVLQSVEVIFENVSVTETFV